MGGGGEGWDSRSQVRDIIEPVTYTLNQVDMQ